MCSSVHIISANAAVKQIERFEQKGLQIGHMEA